MQLEIIEFHPMHLEVAVVRDHEAATLLTMPDASNKIANLAKRSVQAATFMYDGRILMCAGFLECWPGVCEVWSIPTIYAKQLPFQYGRTLKRYVEQIAKTFKYHRLQTVAVADDLHARWMQFLGFQKEGVLRQYTTGKLDYNMYARVFSWD